MKLFRLASLAALLLSLGNISAKAAWHKGCQQKGQDEGRPGSATVTAPSGAANADVNFDHSKLILELINGAYFVRKFTALELGVTLASPVPGK